MGPKRGGKKTGESSSKRTRTEDTLEDKVQKIKDVIEEYHIHDEEDRKEILLILVDGCYNDFIENRSRFASTFGEIVMGALRQYQLTFRHKLEEARVPVDEIEIKVKENADMLATLEQNIVHKTNEIAICEEEIKVLAADEKEKHKVWKDMDVSSKKQLAPFNEANALLLEASDIVTYVEGLQTNRGCDDEGLMKQKGQQIMKWMNDLKCSGSLLVIASAALFKKQIEDFDLKIVSEILSKFNEYVQKKSHEVETLKANNAEMVMQIEAATRELAYAKEAHVNKKEFLDHLKTELKEFEKENKSMNKTKKDLSNELSPFQETFTSIEDELKTITDAVALATELSNRTEHVPESEVIVDDYGQELKLDQGTDMEFVNLAVTA